MNDNECLQIQEIISVAADGERLDAEEIARAKRHCAACESCTRFVGVLANMRKVPTPAVDEGVVVATLAAIVREQQATKAAAAAEVQAAAKAGTEAPGKSKSWLPPSIADLLRHPKLVFIGAAASILVVAGFGTIVGVRYLMTPAGPQTAFEVTADAPMPMGADTAIEAPPPADVPPQAVAPEAAPATGARFAVLGENVYQVAESPSLGRPEGDSIGSIITDLGSGSTGSHQAYATREVGTIMILGPDDVLYEATLVTRTLRGRTFALTSGTLGAFGMWPILPPRFAPPAEEDGAPTFEQAGRDDQGTPIFAPPGASPEAGFAMAPETSGVESLAGSPNWSWWVPVE
ncbi:MAG: zf-HC2 domain-containing protein [Actinobacteria bacterium]|nr:zf-HC2 domain-containing protein [Actinomycetota bacterium]